MTSNFDRNLIDKAMHLRQAVSLDDGAHPPAPVLSESHKRLEALKLQIAEELLAERRLREIEKSKPKLDPLSLAPPNEAKKQRQITSLDQSFHVLVQSLKLDSWVQKELESELDRKSQEMDALQAQNERLREIITLRQETNQRREAALQNELDRLRGVTRRAAPADLTGAMDELREMKELVNAGADTLYDTLKQRAVSERLALVRTFTVRIREVQQLIEQQRESNTKGAQEWIDRYATLEAEHELTAGETEHLREEVETLREQVEKFESTSTGGRDRCEVLIEDLASLKADNLRLDEHCRRLQSQISDLNRKANQQQQQQDHNHPHQPQHHHHRRSSSTSPVPGGGGGSRPVSATNRSPPSSNSSRPPSALAQHQQQQRLPPRAPPHASNEEKAATALRRLRSTLDTMRGRIKEVRAAHIEHLQERTELELFLRQCVDDVRKDLERASGTDVFMRFSDEEKKRVCDILSAKLRVLTALHKRTFPNKLSPAMDFNFPVDAVMYTTSSGDGDSPHHQHDGVHVGGGSPLGGTVDAVRGHDAAAAASGAIHPSKAMPSVHKQQQSSSASRSRPPRAASSTGSSSAAAVGNNNNNNNSRAHRSMTPQQQQLQHHRAPTLTSPEQQQDDDDSNSAELMDSLWTKWQDWNARVAPGKRR